jgi:cell division protease FtsH
MALGVTMQLPETDKHNYTLDYLETRIAVMMGGRLAEEIFLNQMSTGAGSDIESATDMARKMVCEWGMSSLGPLTFGKKDEQIFLGREIGRAQDYSEGTARSIDEEVKRFVMDNYERARVVLSGQKDVLLKIADELLLREVLDASQVLRLAKGLELEEPVPVRRMPPAAPADEPRREAPERPAIVPSLGKPIGQE